MCDIVAKSDYSDKTVKCNIYSQTFPAYLEPINSTDLGVYRVNSNKYITKYIEKAKLNRPAIAIPVGNGKLEIIEVLHNE